ncbi:MAG: phosphate/phosphite/phosphonate ABC transporter substrate-binding protein [Candidatus Riflebacteria bacterium]|nr:phosphate/phosphite/phosphonate ABC transporter substrate-binding protein [Candidatus Riflebacteria bacterium]
MRIEKNGRTLNLSKIWIFIAFLSIISVSMIIKIAFFSDSSINSFIKIEVSNNSPIFLGIQSYLYEKNLRSEYSALADYISINLLKPVKLNIAPDFETLRELLRLNKVQIAWFSSSFSNENLNEEESFEVLCRPLRNGKIYHYGAILTRSDSSIYNLQDLKGKRFAFVDRNSSSGFIFPNRLFRKSGISPLDFFSQISFTGNHGISLEGLLEGKFDGVAIRNDDFFDEDGKMAPGCTNSNLRLLCLTEKILNDAIVFRKDLDEKTKEQLRNLFVNMKQCKNGPSILENFNKVQNYNGFILEKDAQQIFMAMSNSVAPATK